MSLFQCEECGCMENTATSNFWTRNMDNIWPDEYIGKILCSACGPDHFKDGTPSEYGRWHGKFDRVFLPKGQFRTARNGNLEHIKTGDQDVKKYAIDTQPSTER